MCSISPCTFPTKLLLGKVVPHLTEQALPWVLERLWPLTHFAVSKAKIIRQLIAQANDEDFPPSWQMRAAERRAPQPRPSHTSNRT
jgi:hypothetical protein